MVREFFIFQCLLGFFYQVKTGSRKPVAQIRYVGKGLPQTVRSEVELGLVMRAEEPENAVLLSHIHDWHINFSNFQESCVNA